MRQGYSMRALQEDFLILRWFNYVVESADELRCNPERIHFFGVSRPWHGGPIVKASTFLHLNQT